MYDALRSSSDGTPLSRTAATSRSRSVRARRVERQLAGAPGALAVVAERAARVLQDVAALVGLVPSGPDVFEDGQEVLLQSSHFLGHRLGRWRLAAELGQPLAQLSQVEACSGSRRVRVLDTKPDAHLVAAGHSEGADARQVHRARHRQRDQPGPDDADNGLPASAAAQRPPRRGEHGKRVEPYVGNCMGSLAQAGDDVVRRV